MYVICDLFNKSIDEYISIHGLKSSVGNKPGDIYFMYKGGNVLRLLYSEFKKNITKESIDAADKFFAKSFKKLSTRVDGRADRYRRE